MTEGNTPEGISFEKLAKISPAAVTKVDRDCNYVYANSKAEELLGLEKSEIQNRTYNDPNWKITDFEGNEFPEEELPFQQVKNTRDPVFDVKFAIERPDGKHRLLSINASPLFDDDGKFDGMVSVIEDITGQVETREELKQSRERYHKYFEELGDAVFILAMVGEVHGKILEVNSTAVKQTGYSRDELVGMNMIKDLSFP
ncbi:PAS domain-containing protein, partial [Candidatus Bipolaricaulota bacterium]|nr:PAS domain-containing protein [Candidatus Bipolaricaulota bacterium]